MIHKITRHDMTIKLRFQAPLIWVISVDLMHDRHDHLDHYPFSFARRERKSV